MTSFPRTSPFSEPAGEDAIPAGTLAYFRARNRNRLYDLVMQEFVASGITRATLARRLKRRPEVVSRLLGAPGNWTLDTVSDLLFAIDGGEVDYATRHPLAIEPPRRGIPDRGRESSTAADATPPEAPTPLRRSATAR